MNQQLSKNSLRHTLAVWLSLVGHPIAVIPLTIALLTWKEDFNTQLKILIPILVLMVILFLYSQWEVRRGRWKDSDASQPPERKTLLIVLLVCLVVSVIITSTELFPSRLAIGMFVSSVLVIAAMVLSRWLKVSFHSAFNAFCSVLLFPLGAAALTGAFVWTAIVSWSRVVLRRHTISEVVVGTVLGIGGGLLFLLLSQQLEIK